MTKRRVASGCIKKGDHLVAFSFMRTPSPSQLQPLQSPTSQPARNPFKKTDPFKMVVVAVAGGTGGLGRMLVDALVATGKHDVKILARKVGVRTTVTMPLR